jgi:hypothetical protein
MNSSSHCNPVYKNSRICSCGWETRPARPGVRKSPRWCAGLLATRSSMKIESVHAKMSGRGVSPSRERQSMRSQNQTTAREMLIFYDR